MRNFFLVLLASPILFGCLESETASVSNDDGGGDPSGNQAPTISGNPSPGILFGENYNFQPNASDPEGDPLTFAAQNRPNWASFDTSTGRLSGQPTLADVGVYENIVISVSDGSNGDSLPSYTLTVSQSALGSVSLSWNAPSQNADGSALTDLAGYRLYYRSNSSGGYDQQIQIDGAGTTSYVVESLTPDTYFFAATAFNSTGIESEFSGEVVRTVQ